nr:hypothetical protein [Pseudoclavibacter sp. Marseille-Q3772]
MNDFEKIPQQLVNQTRERMLELNQERIDAESDYIALKGRRGLTETQRQEREAKRRAVQELTKQIKGLRKSLEKLYAPPSLSRFESLEDNMVVRALNRLVDGGHAKSNLQPNPASTQEPSEANTTENSF